MTQDVNRQIMLATRPSGAPKDSNFRLVETTIPEPKDGELLCQTIYLSLDPYMRGRMNAAKSYVAPAELDAVMEGGTVGRVLETRVKGFTEGDIVVGRAGWQEYAAVPGASVRKINQADAPISTALGVLGMPGMTAYAGFLNIGEPKPEETLVVAAASGAVGSAVGQIAKIKGCRAVGIAGGTEKCAYVAEELGFDLCINHREPSLGEALKVACPNGIDIYFENVGGVVFEAVWPLLNPFSRVPVCGLISQYNAVRPRRSSLELDTLMRGVLTNRVNMRGFIVSDFADQADRFRREMGDWVRSGLVKYREDVVEGLENAPRAFQGLLTGANLGKLLVQVSPDPTR
jgi:NADPH-dependent curcumin reductase CurA